MLRRTFLLGASVLPVSMDTGPHPARLNLADYHITFQAKFSDPNRRWFRHEGGPFSTRMEDWGGLRTLPNNAEQQLYVDPAFVPDPSGTNRDGRNDAPHGIGQPLGYDPFSIRDGCLEIAAIPTPAPLRKRVDRAYLSGLIATDQSFTQRFGYFEIRAQFPPGRGLWPAFWMVSAGSSEEVDVVETIGEQSRIYNSVHLPTHPKLFEAVVDRAGFNYSDGQHTYGTLWTETELIFFVDGIESARADAALLRNAPPMYLIANLAVGGDWPGNPTPATHFPAIMRIDYIKVYQRT